MEGEPDGSTTLTGTREVASLLLVVMLTSLVSDDGLGGLLGLSRDDGAPGGGGGISEGPPTTAALGWQQSDGSARMLGGEPVHAYCVESSSSMAPQGRPSLATTRSILRRIIASSCLMCSGLFATRYAAPGLDPGSRGCSISSSEAKAGSSRRGLPSASRLLMFTGGKPGGLMKAIWRWMLGLAGEGLGGARALLLLLLEGGGGIGILVAAGQRTGMLISAPAWSTAVQMNP